MIRRSGGDGAGVFFDLGEAIRHADACRVLTLEGDEMRRPDLVIPPEIAKLVHLEELRLAFFDQVTFPEAFRELSSLETLAVDATNTAFPAVVLSLTNLRSLSLELPGFEVPKAIRSLRKLETLDLEGATDLGRGIGGLKRLRSLSASGGGLRSLPEEVGALTGLRYLDLSYAALPNFPRPIVKLSGLEELDISYTDIDELPLDVGHLQNLRALRFSKPGQSRRQDACRSRVKQIRQAWCDLTKLETLALDGHEIIVCSSNVAKLTNLVELDLGYNRMPTFPEELCTIPNLRSLNLDFNRLPEIPASFAAWPLEALSLVDNPLTSPEPLFALDTLKALDLRRVPFTAAQFEAIKEALPACRVVHL